MTRLFYKLFTHSFDALHSYENSFGNFDDWSNAKSDINHKTNTLVFEYLSKKHANGEFAENPVGQQFYIDTIVGVLRKHYGKRMKLYRAIKQKQLFALLNVLVAWSELLLRMVVSVKRFGYRYHFVFPDMTGITQTDVCIAFPKHAFSYEAEALQVHPRSFAEFLIAIEYAEIGSQNMVSVDGYERASKKHEKENAGFVLPLTYKHNSVSFSLEKNGFVETWSRVKEVRRSFKKFIRNGNLFLLYEYFNQAHVERKYLSLFRQIENRGTTIRRIYVLSFFDIGLLKYGSAYNNLIRIYSYSQNLFIPPAPALSSAILKRSMDGISVDDVLKECELQIFSFYAHNPVGFTEHCFAMNYFRSLVNKQFNLSIPVTMEHLESVTANVGYESLMNVDMPEGMKSIIVFDVPTETEKKNIGRTIIGDITARENFTHAFYNDIVSVAVKYNCRVLLKPKYSLSAPEFPASYRAIIQSMQEKAGGRISVLNPYAALKIPGGKIDLSISFPFTSTYYTVATVCKQSVFYAPTPYENAFAQDVETKLVLGKEKLENIIKYL